MKINFWNIIKKIAYAWDEDKIPRLSAALAYYTIFSITPLLIIGIAFAGLFLGPEASRGQIVDYISSTVGLDAGLQIQSMILHASAPTTAKTAQLIGFIMLIVGISGLFGELQSGLNTIWAVKIKSEKNWWKLILNRILSLVMVLGAAFLLLASVILDILLTVLSKSLSNRLLGSEFWLLKSSLPSIISFFVITLLFGLIFKVLPNKSIKWKDIWIGAIFTSILFTFGKYILGIYLSHSSISTIYGASGSFVVLLIWVYYISQIFYLGAEASKVISLENNSQALEELI